MNPPVSANFKGRSPDRSPPSAASVALRATLQAVILIALSGFLWWKLNKPVPAMILAAAASVNLICGWFIPTWFRAIDKTVQAGARLIGTAMTWLLLVPFFYLFFGIARLGLAIRGKDPMSRKWDKTKSSYWVDRPPVTDPAHYTRQY